MSWGAMKNSVKILLIEDTSADICFIREMLNIQNPTDSEISQSELIYCNRISDSMILLSQEKFDIILLDLFLPDSNGIDTFITLRNNFSNIPVMILTSLDDETLAQTALREGAQDYLVKEYVDSHLLRRSIYYAIERHNLQMSLAAEKERLAVTLRSIGDGVIAINNNWEIVLMNKVAESLSGWLLSDALGKPLCEIFHIANEVTGESCDSFIKQAMDVNKTAHIAIVGLVKTRTGKEFLAAGNMAPIVDKDGIKNGVVLAFRDITEQRILEKEFIRTSKLEAIQLLAGGIAHDFNNILMGIVGNISVVKTYSASDPLVPVLLTEAERAAMCGAALTQKLLTFFKDGLPSRKKTVSITEILLETASFALRGSNVHHVCKLDDDLWQVEADEIQMSQVIHNLVMNATQAMPDGGTVTISATNTTAPDKNDPFTNSLSQGYYVKISVKDQGPGIHPKHLDKIFDPYFTTKPDGHGLGLSTSYFIIKHHGGDIHVESDVGKGTSFHFYIPAVPQVPGNNIWRKGGEDDMVPLGGTGKILLMDDEEMIRNVVGRMLEQLGYEVEFAKEGNDAVTSYMKALNNGETFDAVILDLTVPGGMGGKETSKKIFEFDSKVKIIISSGYTNDLISREEDFSFLKGYLAKPYRLGEMDKVLRKVIGETTSKHTDILKQVALPDHFGIRTYKAS